MPVSVDAKPLAVAVTVIPEGPEDGFSVREMTVPVKVAVVESLAVLPEAVTVLAAPALEKVKVGEVGENVHDPPPLPPVVIEHSGEEPGPVTEIVASVEASPLAVAVTVTPEGPEDGLSVSEATVPVKMAVVESLAVEPTAVIVLEAPPLLNPIPTEALAVN